MITEVETGVTQLVDKERLQMYSRIYFVVTCGRSGSTSLSRILDTAKNGTCLVEPRPDLTIESRDLLEGRLDEPRRVLVEQMFPRIAKVMDRGQIYGEKNLTLGPFIPFLYEMLKCKFVHLVRDGRDVVSSFMNWHNEVYGTIYRECKESGPLSPVARKYSGAVPIAEDTYDYSRPRPGRDDPFYHEWAQFSRFEMISWYWAFSNRMYREHLASVPREDWISLDYTNVSSQDIKNAFEFLGLAGFDEESITAMLQSKINSLRDGLQGVDQAGGKGVVDKVIAFVKGGVVGRKELFPKWEHWDDEHKRRFDRIASAEMQKFGYY